MSQFTVPQPVSQNIARAKSFIKRDDPIRALDSLITALQLYDPSKLMGKARFEVEVTVEETVTDLNRLPQIRALIEALSHSSKAHLAYTPGQEEKLLQLLGLVRKGVFEAEKEKLNKAEQEKEARRAALEQKGLGYLKAGDTARGKATLRVLADEFGNQPDVLVQVAQWFLDAELFFEAAEFAVQAVEDFPKDGKAYGIATSAYFAAREFEKGEEIYLKAIRQFGNHPKTLLNLAKLYVEWNKRDKAFDAAQLALTLDPGNAEAKAIVDKFG